MEEQLFNVPEDVLPIDSNFDNNTNLLTVNIEEEDEEEMLHNNQLTPMKQSI